MSQLIFKNEYVIVSQIFKESEKHVHPMMQIFIGDENNQVMVDGETYRGKIIIINQNVDHSIQTRDRFRVFLLVKPASLLAQYIRKHYLQNHTLNAHLKNNIGGSNDLKEIKAVAINPITFEEILVEDSPNELERKVLSILKVLGVTEKQVSIDERVEKLIQVIQEGRYFNYSIKEIAQQCHLSEGRMAHLFKEEVGVSLMSYIQLMQLEYVYKEVINGKSITEAALEAGFYSSSHFAYVCKKITGISISKVMKIAGL